MLEQPASRGVADYPVSLGIDHQRRHGDSFQGFAGVHRQQGGNATPDHRAIDAGDGAFGARRYTHIAL
jgi:hypothetical protein